jgi:hypothetical protein
VLVVPGGVGVPVVDEDMFGPHLYRCTAGRASVELLGDREGKPQTFPLVGLSDDIVASGGGEVDGYVLFVPKRAAWRLGK